MHHILLYSLTITVITGMDETIDKSFALKRSIESKENVQGGIVRVSACSMHCEHLAVPYGSVLMLATS